MERLIRIAVLIGITLVVIAGCSRYSEEEAIFIAHNRTNDRAVAVVDGKEIVELAPHSFTHNEIKVLVARRPVRDNGYGPSQVDKLVEVTVMFQNLRTGRLSREATCIAGAKVKTTIVYEPQSGTDGYTTCRTLDTFGNVVVDVDGSGSQ